MRRMIKVLTLLFMILFINQGIWAQEKVTDTNELKVIEVTAKDATPSQPQPQPQPESKPTQYDPVRYTLGPEDVVEIIVMRHPEFSGIYPVNMEGKIQYKFVGDIDVTGLTKKQLEDKIKAVIANYVISPEVNITITEYKSKVIYVLGEVGRPGKYYLKSDAMPVMEAVVNAGLPSLTAAMRRCQLITPDKSGKAKTRFVDLYSVLYNGDLKKNVDMYPGDILYVPATVMAKVIRVINPVASTVGIASSGTSGVSEAKGSVTNFAK